MGSLTNDLETKLLDHVFNGAGAAYTPFGTLYLALATSSPGEAATGASMNEVANSNAYQRTAITFDAATSRYVLNNLVTFPQATGSWGTVTDWAVVSTQTYGSGDVLAYGQFDTPKGIVNGNTPSVADDEIDVTFSAGYASNYLANALLDFAFRNQAFSQPDTYCCLTTATISDSDTGSSITEPGSGAYARVQVNDNGGSSPTWTLASGGALDNTHQIDFPTATGSWGTIVASCICDASSAGNMLCYDNAVTDQAVTTDDTAYFPVGSWDVTLD